MRCDEVHEQLAEHLLGTLEEPADLEIRRHLRGCAGCRREMASLAEGVSTFARAAHEIEPPEHLEQRVLTTLQQEWIDAPETRRSGRSLVWLARAAAIAAVVGSIGWGAVSAQRADTWQAEASKYERFLGELGGENVRVGTLQPTGPQEFEGSVVVYDSRVGQSWVLVLVRAPGLEGQARAVLSSESRMIRMRPMEFDQGGEASAWLVTSSNITPFDRVTVADASGQVLATGTIPKD